jgi:mannose-6-phosphate isomerase
VTQATAVLLRPDNFTPQARTPWGGTRLCAGLKRQVLDAQHPPGTRVGESWEVSIEPDFPARLDDGTLLSAWLAEAPEERLGDEHARGRSGTALLVKLIDTAEPLSVQIHPDDAYSGLLPGECGKPESWYVVDRDEGAGLFLGFQPGTTEHDVRSALAGQRSLAQLLRFVPVEPGDFFVIDAGTPHAIGEGLTLVEPQHVIPEMRGVTYRYWDWDRRYDASGAPSEHGTPRPLHVDHALSVTRFADVQADDFVDRIRFRAGAARLDAEAACLALTGEKAAKSAWLAVHRLTGRGTTSLPRARRLMAITVLAGEIHVSGVSVPMGRSCVVPACLAGAPVALQGAHAIVSSVA